MYELTEAQVDALVELGLCRRFLLYEHFRQLRNQILRGELYESRLLLEKRLKRKGVELSSVLRKQRIRK